MYDFFNAVNTQMDMGFTLSKKNPEAHALFVSDLMSHLGLVEFQGNCFLESG